MNRYAEFAMRFFFRRPLPHGVFSWRYIPLRPPRGIAVHRRLWLMTKPAAMPMLLYVIIEVALWLKWLSYGAWKNCYRITRQISKPWLFARFLALSLSHGLPPGDILAFRLYDKDKSKRIWDYVYTNELPAWHVFRQGAQGFPVDVATLETLQDKHKVTEILAGHGVPMVTDLEIIQRGNWETLRNVEPNGRYFLKTRSGSCSMNAFVLDVRNHEKRIYSVKNGMMSDPVSDHVFNAALSRDDYIMQVFTSNHSFLDRLCDTGDAVTLRVITENQGENRIRIYSAVLEVPNGYGRHKYTHMIFPIDIDSGKIMPAIGNGHVNEARSRIKTLNRMTKDKSLPCWDQIRTSAANAHRAFPDLFSIAWDFVLTPDGPKILEGNTGWGTRIPQMIHGGLLAGLPSE